MKKSKTVKLFAVSAAVLAAVSCGNKKADAATDAAQLPEGVTVLKLDSLTLTTIRDDEGDKRMPNSLFYGEADSAKVDSLSPDGSVPSSISCFLVETQGKKVLFDTGNGMEHGGMLLKRLDSIGGSIIAKVDVPPTGGWEQWKRLKCNTTGNVSGVHDLYFVFKGRKGCKLFNLDWWRFDN